MLGKTPPLSCIISLFFMAYFFYMYLLFIYLYVSKGVGAWAWGVPWHA